MREDDYKYYKVANNVIGLIKHVRALVKIIESPRGDNINKHWDFLLEQLASPVENRPRRNISSSCDRTIIYNPFTQIWERPSEEYRDRNRGREKVIEFTKKTATTLLPRDGRIRLYTPNYHQGYHKVGLIFNRKLCRIDDRYVFPSNAWTNAKWWIKGNNDKNLDFAAIGLRRLKDRLKTPSQHHSMNEILSRLQEKALCGVFFTEDRIDLKLNAMYRALYIFQRLGINLPILLITYGSYRVCSRSGNLRDYIRFGLHGEKSSDAYYFANQIADLSPNYVRGVVEHISQDIVEEHRNGDNESLIFVLIRYGYNAEAVKLIQARERNGIFIGRCPVNVLVWLGEHSRSNNLFRYIDIDRLIQNYEFFSEYEVSEQVFVDNFFKLEKNQRIALVRRMVSRHDEERVKTYYLMEVMYKAMQEPNAELVDCLLPILNPWKPQWRVDALVRFSEKADGDVARDTLISCINQFDHSFGCEARNGFKKVIKNGFERKLISLTDVKNNPALRQTLFKSSDVKITRYVVGVLINESLKGHSQIAELVELARFLIASYENDDGFKNAMKRQRNRGYSGRRHQVGDDKTSRYFSFMIKQIKMAVLSDIIKKEKEIPDSNKSDVIDLLQLNRSGFKRANTSSYKIFQEKNKQKQAKRYKKEADAFDWALSGVKAPLQ